MLWEVFYHRKLLFLSPPQNRRLKVQKGQHWNYSVNWSMSARFDLATVTFSHSLPLCCRRETHWIQKHGCFQMCSWAWWDIPCTDLLSFSDQDPLSIFSRDSIQLKALQKHITKAAFCLIYFFANTFQVTVCFKLHELIKNLQLKIEVFTFKSSRQGLWLL